MSKTVSLPLPARKCADPYALVSTRVPAIECMFAPRSVALIGATERPGSVGRTILENLQAGGFRGSIHPINPQRATVLGFKAHRRIGDLPGAVDLAVIATP